MYNLFKGLAIIIFMLTLVSCETRNERIERNNTENPELVFDEIHLGRSIYRLENSEVICYYRYEASIECKFKGE